MRLSFQSTICIGMAASMGAFLLAAGTPGKRIALPNSEIMIHQCLDEFLTAAAGPATNLLLALCFLHQDPVFALVNLALMVYNLLPLYPLDGGRILRCILRFLLKGGRAVEVTEKIVRLPDPVFWKS